MDEVSVTDSSRWRISPPSQRAQTVAVAAPDPEGTSWLDLLERECSAPELAAFHRRRSGTVDPERADREYGSAVRVLDRLDERKRQAERLTVLNDLARRLTVMHDPADVLQEVAGQARRLLGVDVAYIMLLREDGVLRIEVVDGTLGTGMRGIELAPGVGLGGEVLRTGRPIWSSDYLADRAFPHASPVDEAAAGERLNGILGVPPGRQRWRSATPACSSSAAWRSRSSSRPTGRWSGPPRPGPEPPR
jgi:hypothetical protein